LGSRTESATSRQLALVAVTTDTLLVMAIPVMAPLLELEVEPVGSVLMLEPPQPAIISEAVSAPRIRAPRNPLRCLFIETPLFIDAPPSLKGARWLAVFAGYRVQQVPPRLKCAVDKPAWSRPHRQLCLIEMTSRSHRPADFGLSRLLQIELPGLADQVVTETVMWLFGDPAEAGLLVDSTRRQQILLRPQ